MLSLDDSFFSSKLFGLTYFQFHIKLHIILEKAGVSAKYEIRTPAGHEV